MAAYSGSHHTYDERDRIDMNTARVTDLLSASGIAPASLSSEERAVAPASTPARRHESPASKPLIRLDRITKRYGALTVLDELSLGVMPGEKLALIGPSGSGKTTILRILMTLETIDGGHIEVDGEQLFHMPRGGQMVPANERHLQKMREKIGMVFQHFNLFPHKSVLDNVTLAPMLTKGESRESAERRALDLCGENEARPQQGHLMTLPSLMR
ncbi:ABC-type glutathione transport system ATPase component [Paraburkholderia sp. Clong3]